MADTTPKNQQWYDVGKKATLTFDCASDLIIRGHTESSLVVASQSSENVQVNGRTVKSSSTLKVLVPRDAEIVVKRVAGDLRIKNVQGNIEVTSDISGDAVFVAIDGSITLNRIHGMLKARDISNAIAIADVTGDVRVRRTGHLTINKVFGDVELAKMTGDVEINEIYGDVAINGAVGAVTLTQVNGDCVVSQVGGRATISSRDDIRVQGPLAVGMHKFNSDSTIALRWHPDNDLKIEATAPLIINTVPLMNEHKKDDHLTGMIGNGDVTVVLSATDRITIKPIVTTENNNESWGGHIDSEFDFVGMTEQFINEVSTRIDQAVEHIPNFTTQAESFFRQTEEKLNKMMNPDHHTHQTAHANTNNGASEDNSEAKLKVLKMLEEGKITIEQAGELLKALE